jgi:hypothetical protein
VPAQVQQASAGIGRQLWLPLRSRQSAAAPWLAAAIVAVIAAAAAFARIINLGHGAPGFLIDAGRTYGNPAHLPAGVPVHPGSGYDGQFMYRLAQDPFDLRLHAPGIRLDNAFRLGRIGYPLVAWLLSFGGQTVLVPTALLLVGIGALAALAAIGATQARAHGLAWGWGLLICWPGLLFSTDFDLAEPLEVVLVVAGFLALRRGRSAWASTALSLAVLTRETAVIAVIAVAFWRVPQLRRRRVSTADLAWTVPLLVFAGWQLICRAVTGQLPLTSDAGANSQAPFTGIVEAWSHWKRIAEHHPFEAGLHAVELSVLVLIAVAAIVVVAVRLAKRESRADEQSPDEPWSLGLVLGVAFACCLSVAVWASSSDLRMFADTYALAALILLSRRPSRAVLGAWALSLTGLAAAVTVYWAQVV